MPSNWYRLSESKERWWPRVSGQWKSSAIQSGHVCAKCERFGPGSFQSIDEIAFVPLDEPLQVFALMLGATLVAEDLFVVIAPRMPPHRALNCRNSRTQALLPYKCFRLVEPIVLWSEGEPAAVRCEQCGQWVPRVRDANRAYIKAADVGVCDVLQSIGGILYTRSAGCITGWLGNYEPVIVAE
jgi:hypothetical protein